jgi:2-succinyl-5-enolpyruvyl-6-hydroxy-3-cyclohexene-1-carboxylate synthase
VAGTHTATAEGICMQNNVQYLKATNTEELEQGLDTLINAESDRPILLEVLTDAESDVRIVQDYYKKLNI